MSKITPEQFAEIWGKLPSNRQVILGVFLSGQCLICKKKVAKPSMELTGEYAFHYFTSHGIDFETLKKQLEQFWDKSDDKIE